MALVKDPENGLEFYELSHPWGYGIPVWPGDPDVKIDRLGTHARDGVMGSKITTNMHNSTHVNAPIHLIQRGSDVSALSIERFFGNGVVLGIPKKKWELVTPQDLEKAKLPVEAHDIVIINTGWHRKYSDSQEYFGHAPGLSKAAAEWLVARKVNAIGVDTAAVDHPLATSLGAHRNGPLMKRLPKAYEQEVGRHPNQDHPEWNAAHRVLLGAGIPTFENVGGDLDLVTDKRCTFHALPWKWREGDACVIRLMAILDPTGAYRIERGA
jgi:kynurenine formamidase